MPFVGCFVCGKRVKVRRGIKTARCTAHDRLQEKDVPVQPAPLPELPGGD